MLVLVQGLTYTPTKLMKVYSHILCNSKDQTPQLKDMLYE